MKNIEQIYLKKYESENDPDKYITDYLHETGDIQETLQEMADSATPCYIGGLLDWYSNNFRDASTYADQEIEQGAKSIFDALAGGFYCWQLDQLNENKADIVELWAWGYIFKILEIKEITDEQFDEIDALDFGDFDEFQDLINEIETILDNQKD